MGLMQKAVETYDNMRALVGVEVEGKAETLAPVGHLSTRAKIEITIDGDGKFVQARAVDQKIVIPVTEESSGRTGQPVAHALCEQLCYLLEGDTKKHGAYVRQLAAWAASEYTHPKLKAVLDYVRGGTMQTDLINAGLLKLDENGKLKNEKDMVCWVVIGLGVDSGPVWTDTRLQRLYGEYYQQTREGNAKQLCMITGTDSIVAKQHLKGVVPLYGNAKIISANDDANFTYRGRFETDSEAASIGYLASQKAHNALKWLAANDGYTLGGQRVFVCWNPRGIEVPKPQSPLSKRSDVPLTPTAYRETLRRVVAGYKATLPEREGVVLASFDAATTGRLAVTYYNELRASDFVDRLADWDAHCCWYDNRWGASSPLLINIVNYAFGTQRGSQENPRIEADGRIVAQHMQRLLACRVDRAAFPQDIMRALACKAGNLQIYTKSNRNQLLFVTCAVIRKYRWDHNKEELAMALEPGKKDRSYQFGRWLAVMEKIERDTYDASEAREPNAIRLQSVFVQRPGYAAKIVMDQMKNAYYPRLNPGSRIFYDRLIGEIMEMLSQFPDSEYNKPLTETYLPGYYLQKNALYARKENTNDMEDENHDA